MKIDDVFAPLYRVPLSSLMEDRGYIVVRELHDDDQPWYIARTTDVDGLYWWVGLGDGRPHYPTAYAARVAFVTGKDPLAQMATSE